MTRSLHTYCTLESTLSRINLFLELISRRFPADVRTRPTKKKKKKGGNQALVSSSVFLRYFMSVPFFTTEGNWEFAGTREPRGVLKIN